MNRFAFSCRDHPLEPITCSMCLFLFFTSSLTSMSLKWTRLTWRTDEGWFHTTQTSHSPAPSAVRPLSKLSLMLFSGDCPTSGTVLSSYFDPKVNGNKTCSSECPVVSNWFNYCPSHQVVFRARRERVRAAITKYQFRKLTLCRNSVQHGRLLLHTWSTRPDLSCASVIITWGISQYSDPLWRWHAHTCKHTHTHVHVVIL